jgi:hypothetical protein
MHIFYIPWYNRRKMLTSVGSRLMSYFVRMAPLSDSDFEKLKFKGVSTAAAALASSSRKVGDVGITEKAESPRRQRKATSVPADLNVNLDWVFDVLVPKLQEGEVDFGLADLLVSGAHVCFSAERLFVELDFAEEVETIVVGDIHGQFSDLLLVFQKFGRPSARLRYLFNGDIVDRGPRSIACWLVLCALKMASPDFLFITRGNHESRTINLLHSSFARECATSYPQAFYVKCQHVFDELPVAYTINKSIFVSFLFQLL